MVLHIFLQEINMRPSVSYLICATARSGSTFLCEALINTGIAGRPNEYFEALKDTGLPRKPVQYFEGLNNPEIAQILSKLPSVPDTHVYLTRSVTNYADYLAKAIEEGTTPNGVFGAKLTWDSFDDFILHLRQIPAYKETDVSSLLGTLFPHLHYIWITRRDKVKQAVSLWKAIQTWVWEVREQPQATDAPSEREIVFHFEAIDFLLQQIESYETAMQQYFDANNIQPFVVIYEEFIAAYETTARGMLQYLQIPTPKDLVFAKCTMKRQADTLSEEWVQHYLHLKRAATQAMKE
jgi:trehalose 2-sulfotransferase